MTTDALEKTDLKSLVAQSLAQLGFSLVQLTVMGGSKMAILQIMAEPADGSPMTVEQCADVSRQLSPMLEVHDPFAGRYSLEISSPGIDRPLVRFEDYKRFLGQEAKVTLREPVDGRRRLNGVIKASDDDIVTIAVEEADIAVSFNQIDKARLNVSHNLLKTEKPNKQHTKPKRVN